MLFLLSLVLAESRLRHRPAVEEHALLFGGSIVCGIGVVGLIFIGYGSDRLRHGDQVLRDQGRAVRDDVRLRLKLESSQSRLWTLDHLMHSYVKPDDPDLARLQARVDSGRTGALRPGQERVDRNPGDRRRRLHVPAYGSSTCMPDVGVDVVEIDPGVTEIAHRKLGLSRATKIRSINMDGRQFIRETRRKGHYNM